MLTSSRQFRGDKQRAGLGLFAAGEAGRKYLKLISIFFNLAIIKVSQAMRHSNTEYVPAESTFVSKFAPRRQTQCKSKRPPRYHPYPGSSFPSSTNVCMLASVYVCTGNIHENVEFPFQTPSVCHSLFLRRTSTLAHAL